MKKAIILSIIAIIIAIGTIYLIQPKNALQGAIIDNESILKPPTTLSVKEVALKDKIIKNENLTVSEWQDTAPKLLEKMIKQSGISDAEFINKYKGKEYKEIIKELDKIIWK